MVEKIESELSTLDLELREKKYMDYWKVALSGACRGGHLSLAELIIKKIDMANHDPIPKGIQLYKVIVMWDQGWLCDACSKGHKSLVKLMISKIENDVLIYPIDTQDEIKISIWNTGLLTACRKGYTKIVKLMIKMGANDIDTGIEYSIYNGHFEITEYLLLLSLN